MRLKEGDEIAYAIDGDRVVLTRPAREQADAPFASFSEWDSAADRKAYADLWALGRHQGPLSLHRPAPSMIRMAKIATIKAKDAERIGHLPAPDRIGVAGYLTQRLASVIP